MRLEMLRASRFRRLEVLEGLDLSRNRVHRSGLQNEFRRSRSMECEEVSMLRKREYGVPREPISWPHLLPSPPSLAEPENSMVAVSPETVLERFANSIPSSSSFTKTLKAVLLGGIRHGKLAVRPKIRQISRDRGTDSKRTTHTPRTGPTWVSGRLESSMASEPDSLASDIPRFLLRAEGVVDIICKVLQSSLRVFRGWSGLRAARLMRT